MTLCWALAENKDIKTKKTNSALNPNAYITLFSTNPFHFGMVLQGLVQLVPGAFRFLATSETEAMVNM